MDTVLQYYPAAAGIECYKNYSVDQDVCHASAAAEGVFRLSRENVIPFFLLFSLNATLRTFGSVMDGFKKRKKKKVIFSTQYPPKDGAGWVVVVMVMVVWVVVVGGIEARPILMTSLSLSRAGHYS